MAFRFVALCALVACASAGLVPSAPLAYATAYQPYAKTVVTKTVDAEHDPHPQYNFSYDVADSLTGDNKNQQETRDGDVVSGSYSVVDPDGTKRTVEYNADPVNGFNAVVHKEPISQPIAPVAVKTVAQPIAAYHAAPAVTYAAAAPAIVKNFAQPIATYHAAPAVTSYAAAAPAIVKSFAQPIAAYHAAPAVTYAAAAPAIVKSVAQPIAAYHAAPAVTSYAAATPLVAKYHAAPAVATYAAAAPIASYHAAPALATTYAAAAPSYAAYHAAEHYAAPAQW